eukprot:tig00000403_g357.t1
MRNLVLSRAFLEPLDLLTVVDLYVSRLEMRAYPGLSDAFLRNLRSHVGNLTALDLSENPRISEDGFLALLGDGPLPNLRELRLEGMPKLGDATVQRIGQIQGLQTLVLRGASVSEFAPLAALRSLRVLDVSGTGFSDASAHHLLELKELERLDVCGCEGLGDEGLLCVGELPALASLAADWTRVSTAGPLAGLSRLARLSLACTPLDEAGAEALGSIPSLTSLDLAGTAAGDRAASAALCRLPSLRSLDLSRTPLTAAGLAALAGARSRRPAPPRPAPQPAAEQPPAEGIGEAAAALLGPEARPAPPRPQRVPPVPLPTLSPQSFPALTSLDLSGTEVGGDAATGPLSTMRTLTSLDLSGTPAGAEACGALLSLPALRRLRLDRTEAGDEAAPLLRALPSLTALSLCGTPLTDSGVAELVGCPLLAELSLARTHVSDHAAAALSAMPALTTLDLSATLVSDRGLRTLALPRLASLAVSDNRAVSAAGLDALAAPCPALRSVSARGTSAPADYAFPLSPEAARFRDSPLARPVHLPAGGCSPQRPSASSKPTAAARRRKGALRYTRSALLLLRYSPLANARILQHHAGQPFFQR